MKRNLASLAADLSTKRPNRIKRDSASDNSQDNRTWECVWKRHWKIFKVSEVCIKSFLSGVCACVRVYRCKLAFSSSASGLKNMLPVLHNGLEVRTRRWWNSEGNPKPKTLKWGWCRCTNQLLKASSQTPPRLHPTFPGTIWWWGSLSFLLTRREGDAIIVPAGAVGGWASTLPSSEPQTWRFLMSS